VIVLRSTFIGHWLPNGMARGAVLALALASAPVAAQLSDNDDGPPLQGGILTTPITQGRSWSANFVLNSLSDSNFRRTSGPNPESATRISPGVTLAAGLPVGQQQLFIGGNYGLDFTINNSDFNRSRWSLGGGAGWRLGARCSGVVGAEASERLNLVFDQSVFSDNVRRTTAVAATANCQSGAGLGFGGSFGQINATNNRPEQELFDVKTTLFSANVFYGSQALGQFSIGGSMNDSDYSQRLVLTPDGIVNEGVTLLSGQIGYSRSFGTRLQASVSVSYLESRPKPGSILQFTPDGQIVQVERSVLTGNGFNLSLIYAASSRMSLSVGASRNVRASPNAGALFTVQNTYFGSLNYELGPTLSLSTGINYRVVDYVDAFASAAEPVPRVSDNFTRIFAGMQYSPQALYSLGLQFAYNQRRSDPSLYDFNSFTALISLSVRLRKG
jgi:hypothetical protein